VSLFGGSDYSFANYQKQPSVNYLGFDPSSYAGGLGSQMSGDISQMLSGQISPAQQQLLSNQFGQDLNKIRQGAYGAPAGAAQGQMLGAANQNALNAALLGQQNINQGLSAGQNYLGMGMQNQQNQNQFNLANNQQQIDQQEYQQNLLGNQQQLNNQSSDLFGNALGGLLGQFGGKGLNWLFPSGQDNYYNELAKNLQTKNLQN
jgi:hypothetical protein